MKHNFFRTIFLFAALQLLMAFPAAAQIFYKVEKTGSDNVSYIFGSHHLAPLSIVDSIPELKQAMENCRVIVGEIDMTQPQMQMAMAMQPYMMAPQDSTISALLSPEEFNALCEQFKPYSPMPGIGLEAFDAMRPMVIGTMVSAAMIQKSMPRFKPDEQLDTYFQKSFKEQGKTIRGLETPEMQARLLYSFIPIPGQIELLKEMLADPGKLEETSEKLNKAYAAHDLDALYAISLEDDSEQEFNEALVNRRNADWGEKLPEIFAENPTLVVVGAMHLPGENGILNILKSKGYKITAIN